MFMFGGIGAAHSVAFMNLNPMPAYQNGAQL